MTSFGSLFKSLENSKQKFWLVKEKENEDKLKLYEMREGYRKFQIEIDLRVKHREELEKKVDTHMGYLHEAILNSQTASKTFVHWNGSRPFCVVSLPDSISIFMREKQPNQSETYTKHIKTIYKPIKVWFGDEFDAVEVNGFGDERGSTVLIQTSPNEYIFVGRKTYSFRCEEQIEDFYSAIGNSDVPYPVALTKNDALFMLEDGGKVKGLYPKIPRSRFPHLKTRAHWHDSYSDFYSLYHPWSNPTKKGKKLPYEATLDDVKILSDGK